MMPNGPLRAAVEDSLTAALNDKSLDAKRNAAPIAMLRYMADFLDADNGDTPATRYVTPASFLSYCNALGLTPDVDDKAKPGTGEPRIVSVAGNSKWTQKAASG